jgi:hypothetical protein
MLRWIMRYLFLPSASHACAALRWRRCKARRATRACDILSRSADRSLGPAPEHVAFWCPTEAMRRGPPPFSIAGRAPPRNGVMRALRSIRPRCRARRAPCCAVELDTADEMWAATRSAGPAPRVARQGTWQNSLTLADTVVLCGVNGAANICASRYIVDVQTERRWQAVLQGSALVFASLLNLSACDGDDGSAPCRAIGRWYRGKGDVGDRDTSYIPCCEGLTEILTMEATKDAMGADICRVESRAPGYACIAGTCGDGLCEDPETFCGCPDDCGGPAFPVSPVPSD